MPTELVESILQLLIAVVKAKPNIYTFVVNATLRTEAWVGVLLFVLMASNLVDDALELLEVSMPKKRRCQK